MSDFTRLVESVIGGTPPELVVAEAVSGPDRKDDITSDEAKVHAFMQIAGQAASAFPYVGPDWVNTIADQLRSADQQGMAELIDMARRNRNEYAKTHRIDSGGSFQLWDAVLNGLFAAQTHEVPPPAPPIM
jgi:hypothetical protein